MKNGGYTATGQGRAFGSTHWTEIIKARTLDESHRREVLGNILSKYTKPIYAYLRQKGYDAEKSKDLVQGFVLNIILEKQLIQKADASKGRFRNFLLSALNNYVINDHKRENALHRSPQGGFVSLEAFDPSTLPSPDTTLSPDDMFNRMWASEILRMVYADLEDTCYKTGKSDHWQVFKQKVYDPIINGEKSPSYRDICAPLDITEDQASNMTTTVKRMFRAKLFKHLKPLVNNDKDIDDEYKKLFEILSKK